MLEFNSAREVENELELQGARPRIAGGRAPARVTVVVTSMAVLALIGMVAIMTFPTENVEKLTSTSSLTQSNSNMLRTDTSRSPNVQISYSLNRLNYSPLDYFDSSYRTSMARFLTYEILSEHQAIIEPYADMELYIYDDSSSDGSHYMYEVCPSTGHGSSCQSGSRTTTDISTTSTTVSFECSVGDQFSIKVQLYDSENTLVSESSGSAICMYVRRNIREMTNADVNRFLDASRTLWDVSDTEGQELYGSNYYSISYLHTFHYFNAVWRDADHIHRGNGFLAQHLKFTNMYEASIQSVDPYVTLPYWDYTQDESEGIDPYVLNADMYGTMTSPSYGSTFTYANDSILNGKIFNGMWKNAKVPVDNSMDIPSAYGYLRSPWNLNPSPFVSRFKTSLYSLPNCAVSYDSLGNTDLMGFMYDLEKLPHGSVHLNIGGYYGSDGLNELIDGGYLAEKNRLNFLQYFFKHHKTLYRHNVITPNTNCVIDEDNIDASPFCGYKCLDESLVVPVIKGEMMLVERDYNGTTMLDYDAPGFDDAMINFFCADGGGGQRIFEGDQVEAASPSDPSFWIIHPTLERLAHAKFMSKSFNTTDWAELGSGKFICDDFECYNGETGLFEQNDMCCYGHFADSQLLNAPENDRFSFVGATNKEIIDKTDPTSSDYGWSYVYDKFTWDHCEKTYDVDIVSKLSDLYNLQNGPNSAKPIPTEYQTKRLEERALVMEHRRTLAALQREVAGARMAKEREDAEAAAAAAAATVTATAKTTADVDTNSKSGPTLKVA